MIDDESEILEVLGMLLNLISPKCKVETFSSIETGITALQKRVQDNDNLPDLILSDIMMAGTNGLEIEALLNRLNIQEPVIFITSMDAQEIYAEEKTKSIIICKPFSREQLENAIETTLRL